jgi:vancomycin permeability regulator SanA
MGSLYLLLLIFIFRKAQSSSTQQETITKPTYIIFGKKLIDNLPDEDYRYRLMRLLQCPFDTAIIMGGKTGNSIISEAEAGLHFLQEMDLGKNTTILLEQSSENTLENLKNTRQILNHKPAVIISNRYHLARCCILADSLNISYTLCAAEDYFGCSLQNVGKCLKEAFYIHWFYSGKYWAKLTGNKRMLDKIS